MFDRVQDFQSPCLLFSGGLDSTLVLAMLREQNILVDICTVGYSEWTRKQKARMNDLIRVWDLKIVSFPPSSISFIGDGTNVTAVYDYAMGGTTLPVLRDLVADGDKCIADLDGIKLSCSPVSWDCYITGSRKADTHYALENGVIPDKEWTVGNATFLAPLYDYTREQVQDALRERGLPFTEVSDEEDTGNLVGYCRKCLNAIEGEVWCPKDDAPIPAAGTHLQLNLSEFRKRFSIL